MIVNLIGINTPNTIQKYFELEFDTDTSIEIMSDLKAEIKDNHLTDYHTYTFLVEFNNDNLESVIYCHDALEVYNPDSITFSHINSIAIIKQDDYTAYAFRMNIIFD